MLPQQRKSLRVGITAILCALAVRLYTPAILDSLARFLTRPQVVSFLLFAETGQRLQPEKEPESFSLCFAPESPPPAMPDWILPRFPKDFSVPVCNTCGHQPDFGALLQRPLSWDLRGDQPTVLIYHTHTTESYRKYNAEYKETAPYRTLDPHYNVVSIGARVAELLEEAGIRVIHDREVHDYPSYNSAYLHSRVAQQQLLRENPGILLALDIHRDAVEGPDGQMKTAANVGGSPSAQIMILVGTDRRLAHKNWEQNLSLGLKLHAQLETRNPGIVRPLSLRPQRFNQDLSPGALLVEVGSAGNSHGEAMLAAEQLARAIIALSRGTVTADSADSEADPPAVPAVDF